MGLLLWDLSLFSSSQFNTCTQYFFLSDQEKDSYDYLKLLMCHRNVGVVLMVLTSFSQSQSYWVYVGLKASLETDKGKTWYMSENLFGKKLREYWFSHCSWPYIFMVCFWLSHMISREQRDCCPSFSYSRQIVVILEAHPLLTALFFSTIITSPAVTHICALGIEIYTLDLHEFSLRWGVPVPYCIKSQKVRTNMK